MRILKIVSFPLVVFALFLSLLFVIPAYAADLGGNLESGIKKKAPEAVVAAEALGTQQQHVWSGNYFGVTGGAGFGTIDLPSHKADNHGLLLGGVIGRSWEWEKLVVGLEADISWANVKAARTISGVNVTVGNDIFSTFRGRVGIPVFEKGLLYATGGIAIADTMLKVDDSKSNKLVVGMTFGAGAEFALTQFSTIRAEALYLNFRDLNFSQVTPGSITANPGIFRFVFTNRF